MAVSNTGRGTSIGGCHGPRWPARQDSTLALRAGLVFCPLIINIRDPARLCQSPRVPQPGSGQRRPKLPASYHSMLSQAEGQAKASILGQDLGTKHSSSTGTHPEVLGRAEPQRGKQDSGTRQEGASATAPLPWAEGTWTSISSDQAQQSELQMD